MIMTALISKLRQIPLSPLATSARGIIISKYSFLPNGELYCSIEKSGVLGNSHRGQVTVTWTFILNAPCQMLPTGLYNPKSTSVKQLNGKNSSTKGSSAFLKEAKISR